MMDPNMLDADDRSELVKLLESTSRLCAEAREEGVAEVFQAVALAMASGRPWMHAWADGSQSVIMRMRVRGSDFGMREEHGPFEAAHARLTQQAVGTLVQILHHVPATWPECLANDEASQLVTEV